MKKEKQNNKQIPLNVIRIKKIGLTSREIKKLKSQLRRNEFKILKVKIKPVDRRGRT